MLFKLATSVLFAGLALASPVPEGEIQARGSSEGLHLANCRDYGEGGGRMTSQMVYYTNDANAQVGKSPSDTTVVSSNSYITWEGRSVTGTFQSSGVKFTSTINSNAASQSTGTKVGTGYNGANWNCYKDNGREFYDYSSVRCLSIYYCLKA